MIAERVIAPELRLEPEEAVEQRVILLSCSEFEPDTTQTVERAQVRPRDVGGVVPEHPAAETGPVDNERGDENPRDHDRCAARAGRHGACELWRGLGQRE